MEYRFIRNDELQHHGVVGMKWGVRRYQNYDGSYTKKGIEIYRKKEASYEKSNERYKNAKKNYKALKKSGASLNDAKVELTNARLARKKDKRTLDRAYDQVRNDYKADKGKELYSKGKTVTSQRAVSNFLSSAGLTTLSAAEYLYKANKNSPTSKQTVNLINGMSAVGVGLLLGSAKKRNEAKQISAYYSHTRSVK